MGKKYKQSQNKLIIIPKLNNIENLYNYNRSNDIYIMNNQKNIYINIYKSMKNYITEEM